MASPGCPPSSRKTAKLKVLSPGDPVRVRVRHTSSRYHSLPAAAAGSSKRCAKFTAFCVAWNPTPLSHPPSWGSISQPAPPARGTGAPSAGSRKKASAWPHPGSVTTRPSAAARTRAGARRTSRDTRASSAGSDEATTPPSATSGTACAPWSRGGVTAVAARSNVEAFSGPTNSVEPKSGARQNGGRAIASRTGVLTAAPFPCCSQNRAVG